VKEVLRTNFAMNRLTLMVPHLSKGARKKKRMGDRLDPVSRGGGGLDGGKVQKKSGFRRGVIPGERGGRKRF